MSFPVWEHRLTVSDGTLQPTGPLPCGTAGDNAAARLIFSPLEAGYTYRLEIVSGNGAYDITAPLSVEDGTLAFDVPAAWTAAGTATVRLICLAVDGGEERCRYHYPPVSLSFEHREEGTAAVAAPLWQAQLTETQEALAAVTARSEVAQAAAVSAAADADAARAAAEAVTPHVAAAAQSAEDARAAAVQCEGVLSEVGELCGIAAEIKRVVGVT